MSKSKYHMQTKSSAPEDALAVLRSRALSLTPLLPPPHGCRVGPLLESPHQSIPYVGPKPASRRPEPAWSEQEAAERAVVRARTRPPSERRADGSLSTSHVNDVLCITHECWLCPAG